MLAVTIDLNRLEAYNLTAAQLFDALAKNNMVVPGGTLDTGQGSFNVEVPGLITTAAGRLHAAAQDRRRHRRHLRRRGDRSPAPSRTRRSYAHVNGQPAITLGVIKKLGTNVINVVRRGAARSPTEFAKDWPAGIQHSFLLDQAESTKSLFRSLEAAVLTAVALVMITCVATLGLRPAHHDRHLDPDLVHDRVPRRAACSA